MHDERRAVVDDFSRLKGALSARSVSFHTRRATHVVPADRNGPSNATHDLKKLVSGSQHARGYNPSWK